MSDKYLGKTLGGRYEVREIIGTGGMAIVYKAYCTVLHRFVAIKVLKDEFASDEEFRKRFYNEAQAVAKLSHSNIVSIYDVSQGESGAEYIVMELCEGVTLKDYLRKKHHLSWQETVYFAQQVARALDHAHSRGIIHQDIKPQNIMLLRDGTAKVMDFGIASFANSQETRKVSEAIGSVHYISPEQAKGIKVDYRTDLYSLGIVMYEMLTGTLPFRGETAVAVIMQHMNTVPPRPSELMEDIPPAMDEIVMHAMCANMAQRYGSAMELNNDLERLRSNPNLYLNYTNRAAEDEFGATRAIRYDDADEEATQLLRDVPQDLDAESGRNDSYNTYDNGYDNYNDGYYNDRRSGGGRKKTKSRVLIAIILVALIAAAAFGMKNVLGQQEVQQIEVPKLVGLIYSDDIEGNSDYDNFTFEVKTKTVSEDDGYSDGEVIKQNPKKGTMVEPGSTIRLTVAAVEESKTVTVPSVAGKSYDEAVSLLEDVGLRVDREEQYSDSVSSGNVISSSPSSGEEVEEGSTVTLVVSKGAETKTVSVPDLSGMTQSAAESVLESMNLTLGSVQEVESDSTTGTVIGQTIEAGTSVKEGSAVGITIAKEKSQPDEPDEPDEPDDSDDSDDSNNSDNSDTPNGSGSVGFSKEGNTTYISIGLPSDKDSVTISVKVGGSTLYNDSVNCKNRDTFTVRASYRGKERVVVKMDGKTIYNSKHNFAS